MRARLLGSCSGAYSSLAPCRNLLNLGIGKPDNVDIFHPSQDLRRIRSNLELLYTASRGHFRNAFGVCDQGLETAGMIQLPVVLARAYLSMEMVKPIRVPHDDLLPEKFR